MVENDQNNDDEYKLVELDALDNDTMGEINDSMPDQNRPVGDGLFSGTKDIKRNASIVVAAFVVVVILYKLIGHLFTSEKSASEIEAAATPTPQVVAQPVKSPPPALPVEAQPPQVASPVTVGVNPELDRKVSAIEVSQTSVRAEVGAISQQVGSANDSITALNTQIANLNQTINTMSNQMAKQSEELNAIIHKLQPKKPVHPVVKNHRKPLVYHVQAAIPGRAWLIATNGSTLTIRQGSKISGYGTVKLIDSIQGRVITSSGRVIRFSQEDS